MTVISKMELDHKLEDINSLMPPPYNLCVYKRYGGMAIDLYSGRVRQRELIDRLTSGQVYTWLNAFHEGILMGL